MIEIVNEVLIIIVTNPKRQITQQSRIDNCRYIFIQNKNDNDNNNNNVKIISLSRV